MLCIKKRNGRTHARTDGRTNVPEAICPSNIFEMWGINIICTMVMYVETFYDCHLASLLRQCCSVCLSVCPPVSRSLLLVLLVQPNAPIPLLPMAMFIFFSVRRPIWLMLGTISPLLHNILIPVVRLPC